MENPITNIINVIKATRVDKETFIVARELIKLFPQYKGAVCIGWDKEKGYENFLMFYLPQESTFCNAVYVSLDARYLTNLPAWLEARFAGKSAVIRK